MSITNRTDPRVKRTRRLLEQGFIQLLEEKGFSAITVQDIADRATVNRATFYAHFDDKFALMHHVIRGAFQEALRAKLSINAPYSRENLRILILVACEYLARFNMAQCPTSAKQFEPLMEKEVQRQLYQVILAWITPPSGTETAEIAAAATSWAIFGAALHWSVGDKRIPAQTVADQVLSVLTEGLTQPVTA